MTDTVRPSSVGLSPESGAWSAIRNAAVCELPTITMLGRVEAPVLAIRRLAMGAFLPVDDGPAHGGQNLVHWDGPPAPRCPLMECSTGCT